MKTNQRHPVRLWTLNLTGWQVPEANWLELLDPLERAQCQRFHRDTDRLAYAARPASYNGAFTFEFHDISSVNRPGYLQAYY